MSGLSGREERNPGGKGHSGGAHEHTHSITRDRLGCTQKGKVKKAGGKGRPTRRMPSQSTCVRTNVVGGGRVGWGGGGGVGGRGG